MHTFHLTSVKILLIQSDKGNENQLIPDNADGESAQEGDLTDPNVQFIVDGVHDHFERAYGMTPTMFP